MTNFRILAAEFMGWELVERCGTGRWIEPGSLGFVGYLNEPPFDPENNANDCMALMRELTKHGWVCTVAIGHRSDRVLIGIAYKTDAVPYECDDWKQGVCALAEPILREMREDDDETLL